MISRLFFLMIVYLCFPYSSFTQSYFVDEVDVVAYDETTTQVPVGYGYGNLGPYVVNGKIWVFYSDGTNAYWRTKPLGADNEWSNRYFLFEETQGAYFNVAFDGLYFHFIRQVNDSFGWGDLEYRRGRAELDGSISFNNESIIFSDVNWKVSNRHFSIYSDSNGKLWVMSKVYDSSIDRYKSIILSSIGENGIWMDRPGFPKDLSDQSNSDLNGRGPKIIEINNGQILFSWRNHNAITLNYGMRARLWVGNIDDLDDEGQLGEEEDTQISSSLSKSAGTSIVSPVPDIAMINSGKYVSRRNIDGTWQRVDPPSEIIEDDNLRSNSLSVKNGKVRTWDVDGNNIRYSETSDYGSTWSEIIVRTTSILPSHLSSSHAEGSKGAFHGVLWRFGDTPYDIGMSIEGEYNPDDDYLEPPAVPVLAFPDSGSFNVPIDLSFQWYPVDDANSYRVQISKNSDMSMPFVDSSNVMDTVLFVTLQNETTYYWRVNVSNQYTTSDWSIIWSFTTIMEEPGIPILVSPSNNATNVSIDVDLNWEASGRAEAYHVQVSTVNDFTDVLVDSSGVTNSILYLSDLDHDTKHYWRVRAENIGGISDWSDVWSFTTNNAALDDSLIVGIPTRFSLKQNYPNPFNPTTTIRFGLPSEAIVYLEVYNMLGQRVATLKSGEYYAAGTYEVVFNAKDLPSGVYVYRFIAGYYVESHRMLLTK